MAHWPKLAYDRRWRRKARTRHGVEFGPLSRKHPRRYRGGTRWRVTMGVEILAVAGCVLASIWIIVLWGSRYFGPQ